MSSDKKNAENFMSYLKTEGFNVGEKDIETLQEFLDSLTLADKEKESKKILPKKGKTQCTGKTKKGTPCKFKAKEGSDTCKHHTESPPPYDGIKSVGFASFDIDLATPGVYFVSSADVSDFLKNMQ